MDGRTGHLIFHVRACVEDHPLINSIGPKFSSQGHFHSLQLLNGTTPVSVLSGC